MNITLSSKQRKALVEATAKINLWIGAVRSGKTFSSILSFLEALQSPVQGDAVILGYNRDTIQRNVVGLMYELLGADAPGLGVNRVKLFGRNVDFIGANNEGAVSRLQGATLAFAYADEVPRLPESCWRMLLTRCSQPGSRIYGTANPESPGHWLKVNYIDRQDQFDVKVWTFTMDDNPVLDEDYKKMVSSALSGVWYQRYILGEWAAAEGAIYDMFDPAMHVIPENPRWDQYTIIGIDYGTTNPFGVTVIGYNNIHRPFLCVERELYYSSEETGISKTDSQYADMVEDLLQDFPNNKWIYLDPSAKSFETELLRRGIKVLPAENSVQSGIRYVASLLHKGDLQIVKGCKNLIREMQGYVWDKAAAERGEDKPIKKNDHLCFCAGTLIETPTEKKPIEMLEQGDLVLTRNGFYPISSISSSYSSTIVLNICGKKIECTADHPFLTLKGWKKSLDLIDSDILFVNTEDLKCPKLFSSMGLNIEDTHNLPIKVIENITALEKEIALKDLDISIETYGNSILEKYHPDSIFITLTGIPKTMTLATCSLFQLLNIFPFICKILHKIDCKNLEKIVKKSDLLQRNGIKAKKGKNGIQNTQENIILENGIPTSTHVLNAEKNIGHQINQEFDFVQINVSLNGEEKMALMMSKKIANSVPKVLEQINIQKLPVAQSLVESKTHGKKDVYNLRIKDFHEYYAEGFLVHNCDALRYGLFSHFGQMKKIDAPPKPEYYPKPSYKKYNTYGLQMGALV